MLTRLMELFSLFFIALINDEVQHEIPSFLLCKSDILTKYRKILGEEISDELGRSTKSGKVDNKIMKILLKTFVAFSC